MILDWSVDRVLILLGSVVILAMEELENSGFISLGDYDFILVKGTHKKRAQGKLKVNDRAKDTSE